MLLLKSLILFFSTTLFYQKDCDLLPNGKYQMHYSMPISKPLPSDSYLIVKDDSFIQYGKDIDSIKGRIQWLYGCGFRLDVLPKPAVDSNFIYPFGEPFFELKKGNQNTINFRLTYQGNLHVTVYSGIMKQVK